MTVTQQNPTAPNCIRRITDIVESTTAASLRPYTADPSIAAAMQAAIDDARDAGVSWQVIGDALGMRRGAAYQRYRHRRG